jgi:N-acetylmuramoyl-L-alanine amidase
MKETVPSSSTTQIRGPISNFFFQLQIVFIVGFLAATLFTAWTPAGLIPEGIADQPMAIFAPQSTDISGAAPERENSGPRIGIVAGHWGNDSGAVCPDGLTELDINLNIATLVKQKLAELGYEVDLLKEFDPLLTDYFANALVSIHADSCVYVNDQATGFKVAAALGSKQIQQDKSSRLTSCLQARYQEATGMAIHNSVTPDMTFYHAFDEIDDETTAAIIEVGFMNLDRQILTQQPDVITDGIVNGILCYLNNEDIQSGD